MEKAKEDYVRQFVKSVLWVGFGCLLLAAAGIGITAYPSEDPQQKTEQQRADQQRADQQKTGSKWKVDLKLDGQTLVSYVAFVFGTAVALGGSWVAIRIAQAAKAAQDDSTKLQEQANALEDPHYQQAIELHKAARHVATSLEFLMAGLEKARTVSYTKRTADLGALQLACESHNSVTAIAYADVVDP